MIEAGYHNAVPILIGANSDETSKSVPLPLDATTTQYEALVQLTVGALAPLVLEQYPAADYPSPWAAYVALTSDAKFICPARRDARAALQGQTESVYRYYFTHALDNAPAQTVYGAWHGIDVLYLFDHLDFAAYSPSPAEEALSDHMIDYWARFAATGDPNGGGAPQWPTFDAADSYLELDTPPSAGAGVRTQQCDFWDDAASAL